MYRFWDTIIEPAFLTFAPRVIVEIGVATGMQAEKVLGYCKTHNAVLHGIDPVPQIAVSEWVEAHAPHFIFHEELSLNALGSIDNIDAILIDGDHNWYTVYHELLLLEKRAAATGQFPLIFIHDTSWPYGRRDLYYAPDRIPGAFRKAYAMKGMSPLQGSLLGEGGINPHLHNAVEENNLQNGVLTAVEDFLAQSRLPLRFVNVQGLHGLGIIASQDLIDRCPDLSAFLHGLTLPPVMESHLRTLEKERVEFLMKLTKEQGNSDLIHSLQSALDAETEQLQNSREELDFLREEQTILFQSLEHMKQEHELLLQTLGVVRAEKERMMQRVDFVNQEHSQQADTITRLEREKESLAAELTVLRTNYQQLERKKDEQARHHTAQQNTQEIQQLRTAEQNTRQAHPRLHSLFGTLKRVWTAIGEPFPGFTRFVRHRLIQQLIQKPRDYPVTLPTAFTLPHDIDLPPAAVLIFCRKADCHLEQAINSVLVQSIRPQEIVVVDATGSKEVASVCDTFNTETVRLVTSAPEAMLETGLRITQAPVVLVTDSEVVLHPEYLRAALRMLANRPECDITYTDQQFFGGSKEKVQAPPQQSLQQMDMQQPPFLAWTARRSSLLARSTGTKPADQWTGLKNNGIYFHRIDTSSPLSRL